MLNLDHAGRKAVLGVTMAGLLSVPATLLAEGHGPSEEPVWESSGGFAQPESVAWDAEREVLYVSNIAGAPDEADGRGYISRVALDGTVLEAEWVTGLEAPKGLAIHDGRLYAADIEALVEIDIDAGEVIARYAAPGAVFLNDVCIGPDGAVYVSAFTSNVIYRLKDARFTAWLADDRLLTPNGLLATDEFLLVGAWGVMTDGFATETPGHLLKVSYDGRTVEDYGSGEPIGNLDGVESDGLGEWLVTDWMAGGLMHVHTDGTYDVLIDLPQGSADHEVILEEGLVVIPMMNDDKLLAFRLAR